MTNEYITKAQAIDYIKSMEVLLGCTGVSVLTKGIEGLEGTQQWISVKDRLPPRGVPVLTYIKFPDDIRKYDHTNIWENTYNGILVGSNPRKHIWEWQGDYVTHWMPLPEPPKEQTLPLI